MLSRKSPRIQPPRTGIFGPETNGPSRRFARFRSQQRPIAINKTAKCPANRGILRPSGYWRFAKNGWWRTQSDESRSQTALFFETGKEQGIPPFLDCPSRNGGLITAEYQGLRANSLPPGAGNFQHRIREGSEDSSDRTPAVYRRPGRSKRS